MTTFANGEIGLSVRTKINNVLQHADGTAGELVINEAGADVDFRVESDTSTHALFVDGATGNVGIGVVPNAWGTAYKAIQVGETPSLFGAYTQVSLASNHYIDNSFVQRYVAAGAASHYQQVSGVHSWFNAPYGAAGNAITFTQAMTLDANGNLGIGTSSPAAKLVVNSASALASVPAVGSNAGLFVATVGAQDYGLISGALNDGSYFFQSQTTNGTSATYPILLNPNGGNVGIGTSSPNSKLNIVGSGQTLLRVKGGAGAAYYVEQANSGGTLVALGDTAAIFGGTPDASATIYTGGVPLVFAIGVERMRVDASGNVGIGVVPSAWSSYKAIQVGQVGAMWANPSGTDVYWSANYYFGSGSDRYIADGLASYYRQSAGVHSWGIAPSGTAGNAISFTQAMTLDANGNVGIGTTSPNAASIVDAQSTTKGVRFPNMTTTQKNAIANVAGNVIFDTTLGKLCVNTGSGWQTITSA